MKGVLQLGLLLWCCCYALGLQLVSVSYSEPRCVQSTNPYDPLHLRLPCVLPGSSFWVQASLSSTEALENVVINQNESSCTPNCLEGLTNIDLGSVSASAIVTINITLTAPLFVGLYQPEMIVTSGGSFVNSFYLRIEVTCSNGVFCDGPEMWFNGECVPGTDPCNDGFACTTDECTVDQTCMHTPSDGCPKCGACDVTCGMAGSMCGVNDCGDDCGQCTSEFADLCLPDIGCSNSSAVLGTCSNPIKIFEEGMVLGLTQFYGSTADGADVMSPKCAAQSNAPEKIYMFTVESSSFYYVDIRVSGFDTVLVFMTAECGPTALQTCADDSVPPGHLGSRVLNKVTNGTYYVMIDGYADSEFGDYLLEFRVTQDCMPSCAGKFCGDDLCGGDCGPCGDGLACSLSRTCIPDPCISACDVTRFCGIDECGNDCGSCGFQERCLQESGTCAPWPVCNHLVPECSPACGSGEYCGTDCQCRPTDEELPDLIISESFLQRTVSFTTETFSETHCAIVENCLSRAGTHRLIRFGIQAINQGRADIKGMNPAENPHLYQWSPCHGHYHFLNFAEYFLLSGDGTVVKEGRKQAYCLRDSQRVLSTPATSCKFQHDCEFQGISAGWSDIYGPTLDCQWLEVNDIEPGLYTLMMTVNPSRIIHEASFENNVVSIQLNITAEDLAINPPVSVPSAVGTPATTTPLGVQPITTAVPQSPVVTSGCGSNLVNLMLMCCVMLTLF